MLSRRALIAASTLPLLSGTVRVAADGITLSGEYGARLRTARARAFHLHNEPADSSLHRALTRLWEEVFERTSGALLVTVLPQDANLPLSDAEAVYDVSAGRFAFVSVAAPILDGFAPDLSLQSLPFAYRSAAEVTALSDRAEFVEAAERDLSAASLTYLPGGTFSNGFRVVVSIADRPVRSLDHLHGLKVRVPPSKDLTLLFRTLGALPVTMGIARMREAFVEKAIEAEENPPAVIANFGLAEATRWINVTNHMWTGFNTLANRDFWKAQPGAVRDAVLALLPGIRAAQVAEEQTINANILRAPPGDRLSVIETDVAGARERVKPVYAAMLARFGSGARALAEDVLAAGNGLSRQSTP